MLNKAMLYIRANEQTNKIIVVHCAGATAVEPNHSMRVREDTQSGRLVVPQSQD